LPHTCEFATDTFVASPNDQGYVLYADRTEWTPVHRPVTASVTVGDFDGDGAMDILANWGGAWYVSFATRDRTAWSDWLHLQISSVAAGRLGIGDFDGDGVADVFSSLDGKLQVSFGTKNRTPWTKWVPLQSSDKPIEELRFGDFDGDGSPMFSDGGTTTPGMSPTRIGIGPDGRSGKL
jgi:hypothetical protein